MIFTCDNLNQTFHVPKAERLLRGLRRSCRIPAHGILQNATMKWPRYKGKLLEESFWEKVSIAEKISSPHVASPCWNWLGSKNKKGYGSFNLNGSVIMAHKFLLPDVPIGLLACHHCDNPSCVRPDHIFIGTPKDNSLDMARKGRSVRNKKSSHCGEKHHMKKLNSHQVRFVLKHPEISCAEFGRIFLVTPNLIGMIKGRKIWKSLTP